MNVRIDSASLGPEQLHRVIQAQTEIARLGPDLHAVMSLIAEQAQALTGAAGAVVELAEGDEMVYRAASGSTAGMLGLRLKRASSLSGLCLAEADSLYCIDSETDPRVDHAACVRAGARSMIVVPLIHGGDAVGVLKVLSPEADAFDAGDEAMLDLMSGMIAAAMYNATRLGRDSLYLLATTDPLTGLANRALFYDRLRTALREHTRTRRPLAVLMGDMNGLKSINDHYGHAAGDAAIVEMARRLNDTAREADTVARLGGDEFAVLLSTVSDRERAGMALQRITDQCRGPLHYDGHALPLCVSLGAAIAPEDGETPEQLVARADAEMYAVKPASRGGCDTRRPEPA